MKRLRFDLYSGYADDKTFTEHDRWIQGQGETLEEMADRIREAVIENGETFMGEDDDE